MTNPETAIAVGRDLGLPNPRNIDKDRGTFEFGFFGLHDMSLTGQVRVVTPGTIEVTFERGTPFASVDGISNKFKAELEKRLNPTASSPSTATK